MFLNLSSTQLYSLSKVVVHRIAIWCQHRDDMQFLVIKMIRRNDRYVRTDYIYVRAYTTCIVSNDFWIKCVSWRARAAAWRFSILGNPYFFTHSVGAVVEKAPCSGYDNFSEDVRSVNIRCTEFSNSTSETLEIFASYMRSGD